MQSQIKIDGSLDGRVGLFFVVNGLLLLHTCTFEEAESNGDFLNYPDSHDNIWQNNYTHIYQVDFDYCPRGRIVYNRVKNHYLLYHDNCIADDAESLQRRYPDGKCTLMLDEHYQCRKCNENYVDIALVNFI